jgi:hypothetical protein
MVTGAILAGPTLAAERTCTVLAVRAEPTVSERWPGLPERVRSVFSDRSDIDRCARVHLGSSGDTLTLEVVLEDGRSAVRRMSSAEDVVPALEALLLVPSREPSAPPSDVKRTRSKPSAPAEPAEPTEPAEPAEPLAPHAGGGVGFLFSVGGGARVGDHQASENLGVMATVRISHWLFGVDGRAASYEHPNSNQRPQSAVELTAFGGHRFGEGALALDLMLGPTLVVQQNDEVIIGPMGERDSDTISRVVPRLFLGSRLTLGARSVLSGFVGIEGAAGPSGGSQEGVGFAPPPLPTWMLGFVVGASVGAP